MRFVLEDLLSDYLPNMNNLSITVEAYSDLEYMRWNSLLTKEPETIEWIRNFSANSTFIDIGANIGIYSLVACLSKVSRVISFEPFTSNFLSLMHNIRSNNLKNVFAFNCGISDASTLVQFHGNCMKTGAAEFTYSKILDNNLSVCTLLPFSIFAQLLVDTSLFPLYIKIDVDGAEMNVLKSLDSFLQQKRSISVLIESDLQNESEVENFFLSRGFSLDYYYEEFRPHSITRRIKESGNTARNHVFSNNMPDTLSSTFA